MIRVFLDTNILLSGLMFNGPEHKVLQLARKKKIRLILSDYVVQEAKIIIGRKFPGHSTALKLLLNEMDYETSPIPTKEEVMSCQNVIRDKKDVPILVSALKASPDFFITGDKDFDSKEIKKMLNVIQTREFLNKVILTI